MGAFPGFLFRKADTPAAGTHQTPSTRKLSTGSISTNTMRGRNLVFGGDGASEKYAAWSNATTYTLTSLNTAAVVEHGGKQWVLHTTQPSGLGAFPGAAYWQELRPLLWFCNIWGDVRKTNSASITRTILNNWVAAGNPLRLYQYIYLPFVAFTGDHYDVAAAAWLDANNGWLSTDDAVLTEFAKSCTLTSGSATVACADTSGITVGMAVRGTGMPRQASVGSINPGVSFALVSSVSGGAVTATTSGAHSLTITNRCFTTDNIASGTSSYAAAIARVMEFKDGNGDTWPAWYAKQVAGADATYANFPLYGVGCDDLVNTASQRTADGDPLNSNASENTNYFGTGRHRAGVLEASNTTAAKEAIRMGIAASWREIRRAVPRFRVWSNSGQSKRPENGVWNDVPDSIVIEGTGGWYSPESQQAQVGWRSQYRIAKQLCEETCRNAHAPVVWYWKPYDDYNAADTAALPRTQPRHRDMRFGLASTLLTDAAFSFQYEYSSSSPPPEFPVEVNRRLYIAEMDAPIGVPVEPIPSDAGDGSGIWSRAYTNGIVVVRPKPVKANGDTNWATDAAITFALPFDCVELTSTLDANDQGRTILAGATISLLPRDARILLRA